MTRKYQHFELKCDKKKILWIGFNRKNADINTINEEVLLEFKTILDTEMKGDILGLVIYSLKKKGFVAGADIHEFSEFNEEKAGEFIQLGQAVMNQLSDLSVPTVAMVDGFCLGGGAELALACRYRVFSDSTTFGLPEVLIGILPAWGGVIRLPNVAGHFYALTRLLLTGKSISAKESLLHGIADAVVPVRELSVAAMHFVLGNETHHTSLLKRFESACVRLPFIRNVMAFLIRKKLNQRINPAHYPSPYAILDYWEKQASESILVEKVKILMQPESVCRKLIRVFQLKELLKAQTSNKKNDITIHHVHVVGAGIMGGDIAMYCALKGLKVTLQDTDNVAIGRVIKRASVYFKKQCHTKYEYQAACDRLIPDNQGHGIARADLIIEAIIENLEAKRAFFERAENVAKSTAILASNTSSLSIKSISEKLKNPERLLGIHFFNPATKMELVEVVKNSYQSKKNTTDKDALSEISKNISETLAFLIQIGKLPIPVKDSPGFLVNRVLMPYLMECMKLLDEGIDATEIDEAAVALGFMMGPVELADTVGLDICLAVAKNLVQEPIPEKLQEKIKLGLLGKKTGKGFFEYDKQGRKQLPFQLSHTKKDPAEDIGKRLLSRLMNEAEICLHEEVVENRDMLEAAMIFGMGFLPKGKLLKSEKK